MGKVLDLIGRKFGRLVVTQRAENNRYKKAQWLCQCDCGKTICVISGSLQSGNTKSCGCFQVDTTVTLNTTHGFAATNDKHPLYSIFNGMKSRCNLPTDTQFPRYGARGITVCARWTAGENGLTGFECFLSDMGPRPTEQHTIDRRDNDGPYAPWNCRWATRYEQSVNRRVTRFVVFNGIRVILSDACLAAGLPRKSVEARIDRLGWTVERALTTPMKSRQYMEASS